MMYADSYMTRDEFRDMFDHTLYDKMRIKLTITICPSQAPGDSQGVIEFIELDPIDRGR